MFIHSRALLGAIDQALTTAVHFLLGVMIARMDGAEALGQFAFAYTAIVMANMLHGAMLGEIYSIDVSARAGEQQHGAGFILVPTLMLAVLMIALSQFLQLWGANGSIVATPSFIVAMLGSMCFLSTKVYFYCNALPGYTILCSGIYGSTMLAITYASYRLQGNGASPFLGMAVSSVLAAFFLLPRIKSIPVKGENVKQFAAAAWKYVKWSTPATVLIWFANNGYYLLMSTTSSDLRQIAGLRAVLNLMMPFNTLLVGASAALLPVLTEILREGGRHKLLWVTHRMAGIVLLGSVAFALAMCFISARLLSLVYGQSFAPFAPALQMASVLPALWGTAVVYRTSIRAMGESFDLFKVYFFALFPVGVMLMYLLSKQAAAHAVIGVAVTQLLVITGFLYRFIVMTKVSHEACRISHLAL